MLPYFAAGLAGVRIQTVPGPPGVTDTHRRIHLPSLHREGYTGRGAVIGILDTGVATAHPFLQDNIQDVRSFTGHDGEDQQGHGTHVAGICVQVAPDCRLVIAQVLDPYGFGAWTWFEAGLTWLHAWRGPNGERVHIINASLGAGQPPPDSTHELLRRVTERQLFVAAAGNDGPGSALDGISSVRWPARYWESFAVAATRELVRFAPGAPAWYSSAGPEVDVAAPGTAVISCGLGDTWEEMTGTSMAGPHVAGLAACQLDRWVAMTGQEPTVDVQETLLYASTRDIAGAGRDVLSGVGEIDAAPLTRRRRVELVIGKKERVVDGVAQPLDTAPVIIHDRTHTPTRHTHEAFGHQVDWVDAERKVIIDGEMV